MNKMPITAGVYFGGILLSMGAASYDGNLATGAIVMGGIVIIIETVRILAKAMP